VFFKWVNNSQSYHKSSAQLCRQELVDQLQHNFHVSHGSATRFLRNGKKYCIYVIDDLLLFLTVKEFSKLVNSRSYGNNTTFFLRHSVV